MRTRNILITFALLLVVAMACMAQTPTMVGRFTSLILNGSTVSVYTPTTLCTAANYCRATVTLTDAQIKALPTTPITVLAAPGASKVSVLWHAYAYLDTAAGAYTNLDAAAFGFVEYAAGSVASNYLADDAALTPARAYFSDAFGATGKNVFLLTPYQDSVETNQWGNLSSLIDRTQSVNKALQFTVDNNGAGVLTGGNAANTLKFVVYYSIEDAL